jgi:xylulokinase
MLFLGIDLGTSSIKVSVLDGASQKPLVTVQYPETEVEIIAEEAGWAEQSPDQWWHHIQECILKAHSKGSYNPGDIKAIGIAYQMHGLVLVDRRQQVLRNAIIWCDSRAVAIGQKAFKAIGAEASLAAHLNSPGNFTASKLSWVKENQPDIYQRINKIMLPGDFVSMKLTGEITTSISALSEGIFWDFENNRISQEICSYFGFDETLFPEVRPLFSSHGTVRQDIAASLGLGSDVEVTYKSGDQPNNALSLNVLQPGEVAATAGTSGVIYGVSDQLLYDQKSRINTFAHVNHRPDQVRTGVLLCINGTGIMNSWTKKQMASELSYNEMNQMAASVEAGSKGLRVLPFGNGAERMLENKTVGSHIQYLDLNRHHRSHVFRAVQEGIAFSFRYGLDIMRENGLHPTIIRAGWSNLFLSEVFAQIFVDATGVPIELHRNDGSVGAAIGAALGKSFFKSPSEAFETSVRLTLVEPQQPAVYEPIYHDWLNILQYKLNQ